jgi:hypothetical protein
MIGTKMGRKLFVALQLEVSLHFIERCAYGPIGRFEPPATFGATKPPKTLLLNPYQFPLHGHPGRRAPTGSRLLSMDETCTFGIYGSLHSALCPIAAEHRLPVWCGGRLIKAWAKLTGDISNGLSGILHTRNGFDRVDFRSCERRLKYAESLYVWVMFLTSKC